ncbi:MAG: DUF4399 domain-containing protein [Roseinatronobacter sp.]
MKTIGIFVSVLVLSGGVAFADSHSHSHSHDHAQIERTPAPEGASVYFITPLDGETVSNPVTFRFGARGIGIAPAGVDWPDTGHHHMLINIDASEIDFGMDVPFSETHLHFGGGQTETTLELPSGTHTFMLLMGDHFHVPHDPPIMSEMITVTVE